MSGTLLTLGKRTRSKLTLIDHVKAVCVAARRDILDATIRQPAVLVIVLKSHTWCDEVWQLETALRKRLVAAGYSSFTELVLVVNPTGEVMSKAA